MGFAFGPMIAVGLVAFGGMRGLWVAMVPALLVAAVLFHVLPPDRRRSDSTSPPSLRGLVRSLRGPLGALFLISALAAFVQRVFTTMAPIVAAHAGVSEAMGALTLSVYFGAQGAGTLVGGVLTDRVDRVRLLAGITAAAVPVHMLAFWVPAGSPWALLFAAGSGFLYMALLPPVVVMAQEVVPESAAVGSGIVMGLAWAAGAVGVLGTGVLGDMIGARDAALVSIPALFLGTALALHPALRAHRKARQT